MPSFDRIVNFLDSGLPNHAIARYLNITEYVVNRVRVRLRLERDLHSPVVKPVLTFLPPNKRVPVTRPFPTLTDEMTDGQRVVILTKHGMSARKIKKHLKSPHITERQINRHATKVIGPARKGINNSAENWLPPLYVDYITQILIQRFGKDEYTCEICLEPVPSGASLHHTRYENVTLYDFLFVCQSCNLARENVGLS